jgi:hypothetical protein
VLLYFRTVSQCVTKSGKKFCAYSTKNAAVMLLSAVGEYHILWFIIMRPVSFCCIFRAHLIYDTKTKEMLSFSVVFLYTFL